MYNFMMLYSVIKMLYSVFFTIYTETWKLKAASALKLQPLPELLKESNIIGNRRKRQYISRSNQCPNLFLICFSFFSIFVDKLP